jgi:uroporphyrinogen decarboxylase
MLPEVARKFQEYLGGQSPWAYLEDDVAGVGWGGSRLSTDFSSYFDRPMEWDEWGRGRVWDAERHYAEYFYSLARAESLAEILDYPWPDLEQDYRYEACAASVAASHAAGRPVMASSQETVFEIAWQLRSMDRLFDDMMYAPVMASALLDAITDRKVVAARKFAEAGADILSLGDDVAMQTGLLMSARMWREWLGPRLTRVIQAAREASQEILIHYHSDGAIAELIPDLIAAGVQVLNPVQPECVDHELVKREFGDRIAFWGGLGVQSVIPQGTPSEVREHVRQVIQSLGRGGGLVIAPSHVLETDTPMENIVAMKEAIDEFGAYSA